MDFNELSDELKAKAQDCKNPEDLIKLAQSEGIDLTDEQLDSIAGGEFWKSCDSYEPCSAYYSGYR